MSFFSVIVSFGRDSGKIPHPSLVPPRWSSFPPGRPLPNQRWAEFMRDMKRALRGAFPVPPGAAPHRVFKYTGTGYWDGKPEESCTLAISVPEAMGLDEEAQAALRRALLRVAGTYAQDSIFLLMGAGYCPTVSEVEVPA